MKIVMGAAIFEYGRLLVVKKKATWILPGGKPNEGETDGRCLEREVGEELSGTKITDIRPYNEFRGISPNKGDETLLRVYFAVRDGALSGGQTLRPSAEISELAWMSLNDYQGRKYALSDLTCKVVDSLVKDACF